MIELSIVLLILSLLVGSLLVGRQIVDRAKIQRIIFEFDYYEKAFHQFYDTYRVVPGNMNKKDCVKYSEFANAHSYTILDGTVKGINFNSPYVLCNTAANQSVFPPSRKLLAPTFVQSRYMSTCWLSLAGLIEEKMYCRNWNGIGGHDWYSEGQVYSKGAKTDFRYYPQATFNSEMVVGYHGFDDYKIDATTTYDYKYNFLTYNFNKDSTYEVVDPNFKSAVHKHNTIFIVNSNLGCTCTSPYVNCACKNSSDDQ